MTESISYILIKDFRRIIQTSMINFIKNIYAHKETTKVVFTYVDFTS